MAITYTWGTPLVRPRESSEHIIDGAYHILPKDEVERIIQSQDFTGHIAIEIREGAYTPEQWAAMESTNDGQPEGLWKMPMNDYGIKWRAWFGDPLPEQMRAFPWEVIA